MEPGWHLGLYPEGLSPVERFAPSSACPVQLGVYTLRTVGSMNMLLSTSTILVLSEFEASGHPEVPLGSLPYVCSGARTSRKCTDGEGQSPGMSPSLVILTALSSSWVVPLCRHQYPPLRRTCPSGHALGCKSKEVPEVKGVVQVCR